MSIKLTEEHFHALAAEPADRAISDTYNDNMQIAADTLWQRLESNDWNLADIEQYPPYAKGWQGAYNYLFMRVEQEVNKRKLALVRAILDS